MSCYLNYCLVFILFILILLHCTLFLVFFLLGSRPNLGPIEFLFFFVGLNSPRWWPSLDSLPFAVWSMIATRFHCSSRPDQKPKLKQQPPPSFTWNFPMHNSTVSTAARHDPLSMAMHNFAISASPSTIYMSLSPTRVIEILLMGTSSSSNINNQNSLKMLPPRQQPRPGSLQTSLSLISSDPRLSPDAQEPRSNSDNIHESLTESASSQET